MSKGQYRLEPLELKTWNGKQLWKMPVDHIVFDEPPNHGLMHIGRTEDNVIVVFVRADEWNTFIEALPPERS